MNTTLVTTGLVPLCVGSIETFQAVATLNGLPWDLTGGSGTLTITNPLGVTTVLPVTIVGTTVQASWTVVVPAGDWRRVWALTDALGRHQVSFPIAFTVIVP